MPRSHVKGTSSIMAETTVHFVTMWILWKFLTHFPHSCAVDFGEMFLLYILLGLQYAPVDIGEDVYKVIWLWCNECLRVFYHRLINDQNRLWFCNMMGDVVEKQFKDRFGKVFTGFTHFEVKKGDTTPALLQFVMAGNFMIPRAEPALV